MYWCEVCEKQLDQRVWFYTCDECCVTVHLGCMFGSSYSMKPGSVYQQVGGDMKVVRNSGSTIRLFCHECNQRCTVPSTMKAIGGRGRGPRLTRC
ncbi:hypothetical protein F2Q69_00003363 [Brassica cretica]|uniref:DC1 domain-containing protein n=1 Tax=Brassica cretica TaxID=69181 RepID=A0A8S9PBU6_BRACR|nr:hypothetical protein F2Q69_00003363 [Brassica cretica]